VPYDSFVAFCAEHDCDFNGDGAVDVRDLVGMVNCLRNPRTCPWDAPDCDGSGAFDLQDVFCCARGILHPGRHDGTERADGSLHVTFDAPVRNGDQLDVPVTLEGANPIGGARLEFSYPDQRYRVTGVQFGGGGGTFG